MMGDTILILVLGLLLSVVGCGCGVMLCLKDYETGRIGVWTKVAGVIIFIGLIAFWIGVVRLGIEGWRKLWYI